MLFVLIAGIIFFWFINFPDFTTINNFLPKFNLNDDRQIVVLSAMSGTTNSLVQIAEYLYAKTNDEANGLITQLQEKYNKVVNELFDKPDILYQGVSLIDSHINYLRSFTQDLFTIHEERAILAQ